MELTNEQILKIIELAGLEETFEEGEVTSVDISKALIAIERKLNFFDTNINFNIDIANKNVLIVDDLELSIYQLSHLLKKIGVTPAVSRNKEEASAELKKKSFNYILVDLFLPDSSDGLWLIKEAEKIRKENKSDLKILVISGTDDKQLIDECYKLGADMYIAKSDKWHNDVLKYISTTTQDVYNADFKKHILSEDTVSYTLHRFNNQSIYDEFLADINSSLVAGQINVILNLENVIIFDADNAYIFAEIYKAVSNAKGNLAMINPSERIKYAISFAYLDGVIPTLTSEESAVNYFKTKAAKLKN